jgi:hypothetical protein
MPEASTVESLPEKNAVSSRESSAPSGQRPKHRGGGAHAGGGRPDPVQLGQGA